MKKLIFLFLLISFTSKAQKREVDDVEIIPEVGYSSSMHYNGTDYSSSLKSVNFGFAGDYYYSDRWSLRSGLLFQSMGGSDSSITNKLNYINIPINGNYHFGKKRQWNVNFGATPSLLLIAKENGVLIDHDVKTSQLGLSAGLGYKLEISQQFDLLFDCQGFYGLTDVSKKSGNELKNSYVNFNLGGVFLID